MSHETYPGDANKITREYFDSLLIEMRHIDAVLPDTRLQLFGETFSTPIMTAALSHLNNCHPEGMAELARAAKAADAVMFAGMGEEDELDRIVATGARTVKIIKTYADNEVIFKKIAHAERIGCLAVGMDFDHAYNGRGEYDVINGLPMTGKTLEELKRFVAATKLPFVVKGVLSVQDALKCMEAGVQGIVVSHHAGIMPYAIPPLMILPEIAEAVAGKMKLFVDCGIQSGFDAFKALALGADAVVIGRLAAYGLAAAGEAGVQRTIELLAEELRTLMILAGLPDIKSITRDTVALRRHLGPADVVPGAGGAGRPLCPAAQPAGG
jgi:isopentenyl diphosphate isomerase/L-lactate dehydrogenase-like FMN-dependent dehydrogenase